MNLRAAAAPSSTTMAGNESQIVVPFSVHHNWEMLEDHLVEHLPAVGQLNTFGCEVTLLEADTQHVLCDPCRRSCGTIRDSISWCETASGRVVVKSSSRETCMKLFLKLFGFLSTTRVSSRLKPFSLHDSDMSKWNLGSIPSIGKRGDIVNRSELSSCQNMLPFKGVMLWKLQKCQAASFWCSTFL